MSSPKIGNRAKLLSSQVAGQLIPIAITPLLTRLVDPVEMGIYQLGLAIALVLIPFALLQADLSIPLARDRKEVLALMRRAAVATAVLATVGALLAGTVTTGSKLEAGASAAMLLVAMSLTAASNASVIRRDDYRALIRRNILGGGLVAVAQVAFSAFYASAISLALGMLLGRTLCVWILRSRKPYITSSNEAIKSGSIWHVLYGCAASAVGGFASQMPILVLAPTYGAQAMGHLGLGQRIVGAPAALIGQAVNQVIVAESSSVIRSQSQPLWPKISRQLYGLLGFALAAATTIMAIAPHFTPLIFGQQWEPAGKLMQALALPMCLQFATVPMASILVMLGHQRRLLAIQSLRVVGILSCIAIGYLGGFSMLGSVALMSIAWTASYVVILGVGARAIFSRDRELLINGGAK